MCSGSSRAMPPWPPRDGTAATVWRSRRHCSTTRRRRSLPRVLAFPIRSSASTMPRKPAGSRFRTVSWRGRVSGRTRLRYRPTAYDALFVVHRALEAAGDVGDRLAVRAAFVDAAKAHVGITGATALDEAGDRLVARFNFWAVRMTEGGPSWVRVGRYSSGTLYWY